MKKLLTASLLFFSLGSMAQSADTTVYGAYSGEQMIGSQVSLNFQPAPSKMEVGYLGELKNNGKWEIKDTIGLLNALYKDIMIRDSLYNVEIDRRSWRYTEEKLAEKLFFAINKNDPNKVKVAIHNYYQFIRTHQ